MPGLLSLSGAMVLMLITASLSSAGIVMESGDAGSFEGYVTSLENLIWSPAAPGRDLSIESSKSISENEIQLFHVTSDAMNGALDIKALVNSNSELLGLRYLTEKGDVLTFNMDQLAQGADLMKDGNRSVVKIIGHQLTPATGGNLEMIYLADGLSGSYSKFNMKIMNSQNNWEMETISSKGGRKFTKMFLQGNWFFGKVIGISAVTVN